MNFNLVLLKILPLITIVMGLFGPTKIAEAAGSEPTNEDSGKPETLKDKKTTQKYYKIAWLPRLISVEEAQTIEFYTLLSTVGLSVVVPELLYNPKKNSKSHSISKSISENGNKQLLEINKVDGDIPSFKAVHENGKSLNLVADKAEKFNKLEKIEFKTQSEPDQKAA